MTSAAHTNYVKVWGILLVLLAISIAGPMLGHPIITLFTAFGIAVVKALLVLSKFMHLNIERKYIWYLLSLMAVFLFVLFAGVAPDVLNEGGLHWVHDPLPADLAHHEGGTTGAGHAGSEHGGH